MWYRGGWMVISVALLGGVWLGDALAQKPKPLRVDDTTVMGRRVTNKAAKLILALGVVIEVDRTGTRLRLPASADPPPRVVLARRIRGMLEELKSFLRKGKILNGTDLRIVIEDRLIDRDDIAIPVEILIGGTGEQHGRSVAVRRTGNKATNRGIFIAVGGDGPDIKKPGPGGSATVHVAGGALAIAYGGKGGDATEAGSLSTGGFGGAGQATATGGGQAIGIGGDGGKGANADNEQKGAGGGNGRLGQASQAQDCIALGGTGGAGGKAGRTITEDEKPKPGGVGGDGGDGTVVAGRATLGAFAKGGTRGQGNPPGKVGRGRCDGKPGAGCLHADGDEE